MQNLLFLLRDIIQLRRGPQDVPYSPALLAAGYAAALVLEVVVAALFDAPGNALAVGAVTLALHLSILYILLLARGFPNRFVQSGSTLIWCAVVFTLALLPAVVVTGVGPVTPDQITLVGGLLRVAMIGLSIWKVVVDAHILRNSLSISFGAGFGVAIVWALVEFAITRAISPQAPAA